jgi:predicted RNA-binding Zn ribbon-like protein
MEQEPTRHAHADDSLAHSHLARLEDGLDFINTLEYEKGEPVDHLDSARTALRWLNEHDLMHRDALLAEMRRVRRAPGAADALVDRVRRVRAAMREIVDASVERRPPDLSLLAELNRALRTHYIYELIPASDGVSLDHRHEGDPVDGALARLAESVAREVSQGQPERLRICANEECRWAFNDTSRTGRRKWCDMSTCGNRAKVARHRERKKATTDAEGEAEEAATA